jgi:HIP---CoA ligase
MSPSVSQPGPYVSPHAPAESDLPPSIPHAVFRAAERYGDDLAIVDDFDRVSFRAIADETRRAAKAFMAIGLGRGDVVGVWAPNVWRWIAAAAGAQAAGAVLTPLNTRMRGREVALVADRAKIKAIVMAGRFLGHDYPAMLLDQEIPSVAKLVVLDDGSAVADPRLQGWDSFLASGESVSDAEFQARLDSVGPDDLADIMFTSGTTGEPKGALFSHLRSLRGARMWLAVSPTKRGDRYRSFGPFSHTASYKAGWVSTMLCGCTLYAGDKNDAESTMALINRERINVMPAPPTILQTILAHPDRASYDLSSLEFVSTGAAVVPIELVRRLKTEVGVDQVATGYGLTECCGVATETIPSDPLEVVANTAGRAASGVTIRTVRPDGGDCEVGEPGEVLIQTDKMMLGYLNNPKATAETIDAEGWLHTGDIGALDAVGNLKITDRLKDMYIVGGFNCYPAEIERELAGVPGVMHCAIIGVPDERLGEVGRAFIVKAPGATLTEADIMAWAKTNLANYKAPRSVVFLDALPLNASGKVIKYELRARA